MASTSGDDDNVDTTHVALGLQQSERTRMQLCVCVLRVSISDKSLLLLNEIRHKKP